MARFGKIWQIDFVKIWQDVARFDKGTWQDFARFDKVGHGKIWQDLARFDEGGYGKICHDLARSGKI